ncbi:hypothetical protein C8R43DRAFT_1117158 [Mycena crocata]|nr:hypothetical protein C8R43DRAFT_1117158 [Mycena crocata]
MPAAALPRRTLRSGKEYSEFDLAMGRAIVPAVDFDVGECLQQRITEHEASGEQEPEDFSPFPPPSSPTTAPSQPIAPPTAPGAPAAALSAAAHNKLKSRTRRDKKRDTAHNASANPILKTVNAKRVEDAKASALEMEVDAATLPHSKPAWLGSRSAGDEEFVFTEPAQPHDLSTGLGNRSYTQEEVDRLSGTEGFMYIDWLGTVSLPILDSKHRVITVLGGIPRDITGWKTVTDGAFKLLQDCLPHIRLTEECLHHRRAQEPYASLVHSWSHGGGQTEPGKLCHNVANTKITDDLLAHEYFKRIAQLATILFAMLAPLLFAFYQAQMALLSAWKPSMRRNFAGSIFAACTFNFGPRAITAPHLDFANLAWGWCVITALSLFDPDLGGHLILWDL